MTTSSLDRPCAALIAACGVLAAAAHALAGTLDPRRVLRRAGVKRAKFDGIQAIFGYTGL